MAMDFETLQMRLLDRVNRRVRNGELTERGLARRIGISQPHMHHILKGARGLSVETADRILRHLSISLVELLEAEPVRPIPPRTVRTRAGSRSEIGGFLENSSADGRQIRTGN
jgi:transcriptional regulator with XRE-family HTH domain